MTGEWDVKADPPCTACGKRHIGAGTAEMNCMRAEIVKLRGELAASRFVADSFARALAPGRGGP
jgi:hypothetical protein